MVNKKKYSAIETRPTGHKVLVTRPRHVYRRKTGNVPIAMHSDKRSELNINEGDSRGGRLWADRMMDAEEGEMGKEGWDDVFLEMGASFYTPQASPWLQMNDLISCQKYQHETAHRACRNLEVSGKETFDVSLNLLVTVIHLKPSRRFEL